MKTKIIDKTREKIGGMPVDIFRIETEDNAEIAISRLISEDTPAKKAPVVLMHGSYTNRHFWISPKGKGLGPYLARKGCDVWIPELRGRGLSPKGKNYRSITIETFFRYDLPAIQNFIHDYTEKKARWIGHSFGGLAFAASIAAGWLNQDKIKSLVMLGSQITKGEGYLKIPFVPWILILILKIIGYMPAPLFGMGPEREPAGAVIEAIKWKKLFGKWTTSEGFCYWDSFKNINLPALAFAGSLDKNDPPDGCKLVLDRLGGADKKFITLGKNNGFKFDYGHIDMVIGAPAEEEVWPIIAEWLEKY